MDMDMDMNMDMDMDMDMPKTNWDHQGYGGQLWETCA